MTKDKTRCGAKCRDGSPCKNYAMANGRCRMHGGKSLKGTASKTWRSGLYSKYAGSQLRDVLAELEGVDNEELIKADNELKLLQALIIQSKALQDGTGDLEDLDTISKVIDRLVKAKQRSQKIMLEQERLIPASDIKIFLNFVETTLIRFTGQDEAFDIMSELKNFKISNPNQN